MADSHKLQFAMNLIKFFADIKIEYRASTPREREDVTRTAWTYKRNSLMRDGVRFYDADTGYFLK